MQDITQLVRKQMCGHLFVQDVIYTVAQPTLFGTYWLTDSKTDKVKWFQKSEKSLPKPKDQGKATICARWLAVFLKQFFQTSSTKKERHYIYNKMRFYNDGSPMLIIVYLVNEREKKHIQKYVIPQLKRFTHFNQAPKTSPVVNSYHKATRTWPKLVALVAAAGMTGGIGYIEYKSQLEYRKKCQEKIQEIQNGLRDIKKPMEDEVTVFFFEECKHLFYILPKKFIITWKSDKDIALGQLHTMATNRRVHAWTQCVRTFTQIIKDLLAIDRLRNFFVSLLRVLFVNSENDIIGVMKGNTQFVEMYSSLAQSILGISTDKFKWSVNTGNSNQDLESIKKFIGTINLIITQLEDKPTDFMDWLTHTADIVQMLEFVETDVGKVYLKVLELYACHYAISLISEILPNPVGYVVRPYFNQKVHPPKDRKNIRVVLSAITKISIASTHDKKNNLFFRVYTVIGMCLNRIALFNRNIIPSTTHKKKYVSLFNLIILPTKEFLWDKYNDLSNSPTVVQQLSMLHLLGWWYTVTAHDYYTESLTSAVNIGEELKQILNRTSDTDDNVLLFALLAARIKFSATNTLDWVGRWLTYFVSSSQDSAEIETAMSNILEIMRLWHMTKLLPENEFINAVNKQQSYTLKAISQALDKERPKAEVAATPKHAVDHEETEQASIALEGTQINFEETKWYFIKSNRYNCILKAQETIDPEETDNLDEETDNLDEETDNLEETNDPEESVNPSKNIQVNLIQYESMTSGDKLKNPDNPFLWSVENSSGNIKNAKYPTCVMVFQELDNEKPLMLQQYTDSSNNIVVVPWFQESMLTAFQDEQTFSLTTIDGKGAAGSQRYGYYYCGKEEQPHWLLGFPSEKWFNVFQLDDTFTSVENLT